MYEKTKWEREFERRWSDPTIARGMMLAGFLNQASPASCRILRILELLQDAVRAADSEPNSLPQWERIEGIDESSESRIQRVSAWPGFQSMYRANELLKQYRPPLRLETQTNGNSRLRSAPKHETSESEAAHALVMLAEKGWATLSLLRKCPGCEEWFYAERKDKVSCDSKCRSKKRPRDSFYKKRDSLKSKVNYWSNEIENALSPKRRKLARERKQAAEQELKALNHSRQRVPTDTTLTRKKTTASLKT